MTTNRAASTVRTFNVENVEITIERHFGQGWDANEPFFIAFAEYNAEIRAGRWELQIRKVAASIDLDRAIASATAWAERHVAGR